MFTHPVQYNNHAQSHSSYYKLAHRCSQMCSTELTNATNEVLTQLANGVHALSTHTGHMTSST